MEVIFEDKDLEELIRTQSNHKYRKYARDREFMKKLAKVYDDMKSVKNCGELAQISRLDYEKLKYIDNRYSVRVMKKRIERIIFRKLEKGIVIEIIELNNDHYDSIK